MKIYRNISWTSETTFQGESSTDDGRNWYKFGARVDLFTIAFCIEQSESNLRAIMALADGYGHPGFFPSGYDWSGIRDASDESTAKMYAKAQEILGKSWYRGNIPCLCVKFIPPDTSLSSKRGLCFVCGQEYATHVPLKVVPVSIPAPKTRVTPLPEDFIEDGKSELLWCPSCGAIHLHEDALKIFVGEFNMKVNEIACPGCGESLQETPTREQRNEFHL